MTEEQKDAEALKRYLSKEDHIEADIIKGYVNLAVRFYNAECRAEYGLNAIDEITEAQLYKYIDRAAEDLTTKEAASYYRNRKA